MARGDNFRDTKTFLEKWCKQNVKSQLLARIETALLERKYHWERLYVAVDNPIPLISHPGIKSYKGTSSICDLCMRWLMTLQCSQIKKATSRWTILSPFKSTLSLLMSFKLLNFTHQFTNFQFSTYFSARPIKHNAFCSTIYKRFTSLNRERSIT